MSKLSFLDLPPEIRQFIYKALFSSPTVSFKWSYSRQHGQNIFSSPDPHVTSLLSTCRRIYAEATSFFYADTYFILELGKNPTPGINAFLEKIGPHNTSLVKKVALYRGKHYAVFHPEYRTDTTLWHYARWAQTFGSQLEELRLIYDTVLFDWLQRGVKLNHSDLRWIDVLRRTRVLLESQATTKRHAGILLYWEPSTYQVIEGKGGYSYEPFGDHRCEKMLGTEDNQEKTILRFADMGK
ncbi:MAG: hypothetical protein Q9213_000282 [Squamulea squamosa]